MLGELVLIGTGRPPEAQEVVGSGGIEGIQEQQRQFSDLQQRPVWNRDQNAKMVAQARILFLTGAIAAFASVRLIAGLLLALGPLFLLFLLFEGTRGLFEGWLRALAGAALGALATAVILAVELALLEPWLVSIVNERRVGNPTPSVPIELTVMTLVFVLSLLAALVATAKVARGFQLPRPLRLAQLTRSIGSASARFAESVGGRDARSELPLRTARPAEPSDQLSRAMTISNAVAAAQRREASASPPRSVGPANMNAHQASGALPNGSPAPPRESQRRTKGRVSAGAGRRDNRA
jgi:type IV secretion system protein VirB6